MENNKPLDIVVLYSAGHLGSAIILNKILSMPCYRVVGVIKASPLSFSRQGLKKLKNNLKKTGWRFAWLLLWQRTIQAFGFLITLAFPFLRKRIQPAWKIASDLNIPLLKCTNINNPDGQAFIRELKPDLLVSAYFNQILKPDTIAIPTRGVLNVHPGWLPAYKGAMAYFWVFLGGEEKAGVSLHWIDAGIDTGALIARKSFQLKPQMTQDQVLKITAVVGAKLLERTGKQLVKNQQPPEIEIDDKEEDQYYPMPGEAAFNDYFKKRRFFRIRDSLGFLIAKKNKSA